MNQISIIGSGFSGLSAACYAARAGLKVSVLEKNNNIGGRARLFSEQGFAFDMGPSWYWMPDVFENFFKDFGKTTSDYYNLVQLEPGFQLFYNDEMPLVIPKSLDDLYQTFETIEKGSAKKLKKFITEGEYKYNIAMSDLIYKPGFSWLEYASFKVMVGALKSTMFKSISAYVRSQFKDERLVTLLEFPVLFLGAMPNKIPALYSLMNYSALSQGTWYPMGGMHKIVAGMESLATELGVNFFTNTAVTKIDVVANKVKKIVTTEGDFFTSNVVASADYHHVEQHLLNEQYRNYPSTYWDKKTFAPSSLIFYLGVNKKIKKLIHHNLFFDTDFDLHSKEIYDTPKWPTNPLFYVCCPSKTDASVAPIGMENLFILIPIAVGLTDNEDIREYYFDKIIKRLETICGDEIKSNIIYKKSYCVNNFIKDYNSYKGNAYGLANTLNQTAVLKPTMRNKKISNLFYAGQLTVPGPGVPPAIISGKIAINQILKLQPTLKK